MASDKQRIAQNTLFLYVRMFLIIIVSLYTVRVVIRTLNVTDYGIYMAVGGIVLALSFLSQTIASASQRFFAYELGRKDFCQLRHTFSMIFIVYIIIVLAILFIAETLGLWFLNNVMTIPVNRLEAANWVYQFALLSFIVKILTNPYNAVIIARENMKNPEFHYFGTKHFSNLFSHILHGVCLEQWQELLIRKVLICC